MPDGPQLSISSWLLAAAPIVLLLLAILVGRWSAPRAGAVAWLVALGIAVLAFGGDAIVMAITTAKGLSLSLFVLTIVWTAVYLYNVMSRLEGIQAIGRTMSSLVEDPLAQALLIGWGFAGFIQGITGFGVPVAVAAPLLVMMGFPLVRAAAIVLVGHGWAVTFGSLGSSYYTIQLVTDIPPEVLAPHMALLFALPVIATGLVVAHIQGGMAAARRSVPLVLIVGASMSVAMWLTAWVGAPQIAAAIPGLVGVGGVALLARTPLLRPQQVLQPAPQLPERGAGLQYLADAGKKPLNFHLAFLPYYALFLLSIVAQIGPVQEAARNLTWGLDYPGFTTGEGFEVARANAYAPIRLLNHPAPLIIAALLVTVMVYAAIGRWRRRFALEALRESYRQLLPTTVGVATMVMMAAVMADTGMTTVLAQGIAKASGNAFAVVSPFLGLLGAFMTGSNTNSNILFGALQVEAARELGIGQVTIASVQSIGAAIGSSLAPAKVLVGAALVGMAGRESEILRRVMPYVLGLVLLVGLEAVVLTTLLTAWSK
jgi:lactate permease